MWVVNLPQYLNFVEELLCGGLADNLFLRDNFNSASRSSLCVHCTNYSSIKTETQFFLKSVIVRYNLITLLNEIRWFDGELMK
jgi:hypothetical protein